MRRRLSSHLRDKSPTYKVSWIQSLSRSGKIPEMVELERIENSDDFDWQARESHWIEVAKAGGHRLTNLDTGGIGGRSFSPCSRARMSKSQRGKKMRPESIAKVVAFLTGRARPAESVRKTADGLRGRKLSADHRARISASGRGLKRSDETRTRISEAQKGKKHSDQTIQRMRLAKIGKKASEETRKKLSEARTGKKQSPETIAKRLRTTAMRKSMKLINITDLPEAQRAGAPA